MIRNAICLHEEDAGMLWKHTDTRLNRVEVRAPPLAPPRPLPSPAPVLVAPSPRHTAAAAPSHLLFPLARSAFVRCR